MTCVNTVFSKLNKIYSRVRHTLDVRPPMNRESTGDLVNKYNRSCRIDRSQKSPLSGKVYDPDV